MKEQISIVQMIQLMLAPGLMISACGLLLLGMNNKYSLVVNRIRLLNEERRKIFKDASERDFSNDENVRVESLSMQISGLVLRVRLVKNAVLFDTIAVAVFVLTSLTIGLQYAFDLHILNILVTILFLLGMISVLIGVSYAAYETKKGHDIIQLEVKVDE
ncbi:MAG: DUF2721 domain-containing protein [Ignavibacteriaceae bacterium]